MTRWRSLLPLAFGSALLAAQVVGIVAARFTDARYFCWAPYDSITDYRLIVRDGERAWTPAEIERRYRIPAAGREHRSRRHVLDIVEQFERDHSSGDGVQVIVESTTNGGPPRRWTWPRGAPNTEASPDGAE